MRFIVDLYRYIIIVFCGLALIGGAVALFAALDPSGPLAGAYPAWVIAAALATAMLFILSIGGLAIIVSIHDRHAALSDSVEQTAAALERMAAALERRASMEHDR